MHRGWKRGLGVHAKIHAPIAEMHVTAEVAWRLLSNNLGLAAQDALGLRGEANALAILRPTRAIIGVPR